jgi:hypothetical protein
MNACIRVFFIKYSHNNRHKKRTKKIYMKENIWNNKKKELQIINVFLTNSSDVLSASFSSSSSFSIVPDRFTSVS